MRAVVLAGGSGERFWPESTSRRPKQFLKMYCRYSLLRITVDRLLERFPPHSVTVITSEEHSSISAEELPMLPRENIIGEPMRRNTAPACALGAAISDEDEILLVVPADHLISDSVSYWRSVDRAFDSAVKTDDLITFGVRPTRPETGFGYIEAGTETSPKVRKVDRFVEKPDIARATEFFSSGRFFWNSGMFVWRAGAFMDELKRHEPQIHFAISALKGHSQKDLSEAYVGMKKISVDHAVMERSDRVSMVEAEFDWSDLGSWSTIAEIEGPAQTNENIYIEGERNYVRSRTDRPMAVIGLSDIIVIDAPEGLLVCAADSAQAVRNACAHFRKKLP